MSTVMDEKLWRLVSFIYGVNKAVAFDTAGRVYDLHEVPKRTEVK